jgi:hypothetical protein
MSRERIAARAAMNEPPFEYRTLAHLPAAHIAGVQGYLVNPFYMGGMSSPHVLHDEETLMINQVPSTGCQSLIS